jgi:hypothetical protein
MMAIAIVVATVEMIRVSHTAGWREVDQIRSDDRTTVDLAARPAMQ